jgi:membrane associated rhomboid family serine protease
MAYSSSRFDNPFGGFSITPWVKRLLIANAAVFLLLLILAGLGDTISRWLAFRPAALLEPPFPVWSVLTYAFVHAGLGHFFFNMLALFFFGPPLEEKWGSRDFLKLYFVAALGGALFSVGQPYASIIGASAAINGVLLAYAMTWPDNVVHVWGIFPIKVKWLVAILGAVSVLSAAGNSGDGVAHLAHIGGFVTGFLFMKSPWRPTGWGDTGPVVKKRKPALAWKAAKAAPPAATVGPAPIRRERHAERELLDEVDRILDKISTQGIQSLTEEERERLQELSRQRRTN